MTLFFDEPLRADVFGRADKGRLSVCKVTIGAGPKDNGVWEFVLRHYREPGFGPAADAGIRRTAHNGKRTLRAARKRTERTGIGISLPAGIYCGIIGM